MIRTREDARRVIRSDAFIAHYKRAHDLVLSGEITSLDELAEAIGIADQALDDWLRAGRKSGAIIDIDRDASGRARVRLLGVTLYKKRITH